jgi:alpha-aminoadipic semialdehyde synthase
VADRDATDSLIRESDAVISLLPAPFHPDIAELCIKHKKHLVTASYISPAMKALHDRCVP